MNDTDICPTRKGVFERCLVLEGKRGMTLDRYNWPAVPDLRVGQQSHYFREVVIVK